MLSVIAPVLLAFAPESPGTASASVDLAPRGHYAEGRTASVFAGACHYGGEATTAGREALLAWHFEGGRFDGVELAHLDVVAVVVGDDNLAVPESPRHTVLYVGEHASAAQVAAVRSLLSARLGATLGTIDLVRAVPLAIVIEAETYRVESKGLFALRGSMLPDRACCKMPYQVWYAPFAPVERPIVGNNTAFEYRDKRLGRVWSRPDENASFTGTFRFAPAIVAAR
ncbi:MAG: DUF1326 domain-containing protein [Planctomycetes bacterium]|nr:DUF1326 domain-containing protein [Planctomycetota bacterium]